MTHDSRFRNGGNACCTMTVASAMAAMHVAPEGAFPEQLAERMMFLFILDKLPMELQGYALSY